MHQSPRMAQRFLPVWILASTATSLYADEGSTVSIEERARGVRWVTHTLQTECSEDLLVELPGEPETRQFVEFVYGTPESRRVAVVLVPETADEYRLYVDRNRDRVIRERELVAGAGEYRLLPLDAERIVDDVSHKYPRELLIQYRPDRNDIRIATATTIEHSIHPDGDEAQPQLLIHQTDGNANGLFSDPKDLLQVDLNGDREFDPFLEIFPFRPILDVRGHRWFVRGDRFGRRLALASATATGRLFVQAKLASESTPFEEFVFTITGDDGSVFNITKADQSIDLPVGRYAASVLFIAFAEGDRTRSFTFSRPGGIGAEDWLEIVEGQTVTLNPIGEMKLDAVTDSRATDTETVLGIQPRLFTETGLLINNCQLSNTNPYASGRDCRTTVLVNGRSIGGANSGFA